MTVTPMAWAAESRALCFWIHRHESLSARDHDSDDSGMQLGLLIALVDLRDSQRCKPGHELRKVLRLASLLRAPQRHNHDKACHHEPDKPRPI